MTEPDKSGTTVLEDLPESIILWEILVRLPAKDVLRCRAVRQSWRRATSTRDFLLAHHRHQPSLPIAVIRHFSDSGDASSDPPHLAVFRGGGAGNQKLWPILCYATDSAAPQLHASRDGLLLVSGKVSNTVSVNSASVYYPDRFFYVCNPATRQCAALPQLSEHGIRQIHATSIAGLYLHHPSREYRVLYTRWSRPRARNAGFYITSIGQDEPGRFIGGPPPSSSPAVEQALLKGLPYPNNVAPVLHRGGLHWDLGKYDHYYTDAYDIMVFDTTVETFRLLRRPAQAPLGTHTLLLEMDGALALFSTRKGDGVVMDVFVMQDYVDEVWVLRCRIDLSAATAVLRQVELTMALVNERELLIQLPSSLVRCDIDGKVLEIVECHGKEDSSHRVQITTHLLRESIIPLAFFEKQQGMCASNDPPFFLGLEE